MLRPQDLEDLGRFSKVIYFKENPGELKAKEVKLTGPNIKLMGYGFYKLPPELPRQYHSEAPNYFPYELYSTKMSTDFKKIKRSSYIRFATNDFADYAPDKKLITIADYNFFELPNALNFIEENSQHEFLLARGARVYDEDTFIKVNKIKSIMTKGFIINYKFTMKTLENSANRIPLFNWSENLYGETDEQRLLRITTMIIFYKSHGQKLLSSHYANERFDTCLLKWGASSECISYEKFYRSNPVALNYIYTAPAQLRFLLKLNPKDLESQNLDLNRNLWYN